MPHDVPSRLDELVLHATKHVSVSLAEVLGMWRLGTCMAELNTGHTLTTNPKPCLHPKA